MNFREIRDPTESFPQGSRVHILPQRRGKTSMIHAKVVKRVGEKVFARERSGRVHIHHYKCKRLWCCHCDSHKPTHGGRDV